MPVLLATLAALLVCCLLVRAVRRRAFVEVAPRHRPFLRRLKLIEAEDFLALPAVIVSGHPDRHVARLTLGTGAETRTVYLKREHRVPWSVRLAGALAGFGLVSRSLREARTLQALQREGIGCPEWLAAGEDSQGRAFLLLAEVPGGEDVAAFLRRERDPRIRRQMARQLGTALARMHGAGFRQPDLYAKHVLVNAVVGTVHFLDWQRSRRRVLDWTKRSRDLAALHATVDDGLATPRERLACLGAYLRTLRRRAEPLRTVAGWVHDHARRLLARRHVREKRQPLPPAETQNWLCLDGEALCVTPALYDLSPRVHDFLPLERQPLAPAAVTRRWLPLPGVERALLVRRRDRRPLATLWAWLRGRPLATPEQHHASLLFRLQRHAVPGPRVLAMGQRRAGRGQVDSFLLTEPPADSLRMDAWLRRQVQCLPSRAARAGRRQVLRQTGALLRRLHDASCYLGPRAGCDALAVRLPAGGAPAVMLEDVTAVVPRRQRRPGLVRRDLVRLRHALAVAGCRTADLRHFLAGYGRADVGAPGGAEGRASSPATDRRPASTTGYDTLWARVVRGVRRLRERADWVLFAGADWADRIMAAAVTDRFHTKQGRSTGRLVLHAGSDPERVASLSVYLKRHYDIPWWRGVLAALWPRGNWSPALREWRNLEWARRQGVPVPPVVAAAEYIGPWGRLQSALAVEELAGMIPLSEAIPLAGKRLDPVTFRRWKRTLVAEMARLTRMLHDRRYFHKDLYLCHFYIADDDTRVLPAWRGRVYLIDLHRLARHPWTWRLLQMKDLAQLLYSSAVAGVGPRDQIAFWSAYRGAGPRRGADRWLRRGVLLKWARYRHHNARLAAALGTPALSEERP